MSDPSGYSLAQSLYQAAFVILGGAVSLATTLAVALRQEHNSKRKHKRFVANALVRKIWQGTDEILRFERDIAAMLDVVNGDIKEEDYWLYLMPTFGFEVEKIALGEDEFILLQDAGEAESYSYFVQILNFRESLLRTVKTYSEFRNELQRKLSKHSLAGEKGGKPVVSFGFDVTKNPDLHIELLSARVQAIDLRKISIRYREEAKATIARLASIIDANHRNWGKPMKIELADTE